MGMRRSLPNALVVMRTPGGICRRLYSAPSTRRTTLVDHGRIEALRDEVGCRAVALHVAPQHRIELLVGRKRLVVALIRTQLGRGRLVEHAVGDGSRQALEHRLRVAIAAQVVDQCLGHVLDHGEPARRVPVERGVAGGHLALVPRGQHDPSLGVRDRHQQHAAEARLQVLVGEAERLAAEHGGQHGREGDVGLLYRHHLEVDAQSLGDHAGVVT